jgi:hypothetical protein
MIVMSGEGRHRPPKLGPVRTPVRCTGSMDGFDAQASPRALNLRVTVGRWSDGHPRTLYRTVEASGESDGLPRPSRSSTDALRPTTVGPFRSRDLTVDQAMELLVVGQFERLRPIALTGVSRDSSRVLI